MIGSGGNEGRAVPGEPPQIARLLQVAGRIVQPEEPVPRLADESDDPVAAIADVEIAGRRYFVP
jgi:hypothetical protein